MTSSTAPATKWAEPAKAGARRSILAADLVIEGDVTSTGPVDVQGRVAGQVKAPEVLISPTGTIDGTALAHDLAVQGQISGAVEAHTVSLSASAVIQADVTHERIAIESGAEIEGQLKRLA
ncbi:MAG: polymer-forming cytoskeletal protein [Paracoccaceae bacterium]